MRPSMLFAALLFGIAAAVAVAQPKPPGAKPAASQPARVRDGLVNGALRFLVPAEWEITQRTDDKMQVFYRHKAERATYSMMVTQQAQGIPQHDARVRKQLTDFVLQTAAAELQRRGVEVIEAPKLERDDRFMARVHEKFKDGDAIVDAVHFYRGVGLNLISVTSSTTNEEPNQVKAVHDAGALMLMSVTLGAQDPKIVRPVNAKKDE